MTVKTSKKNPIEFILQSYEKEDSEETPNVSDLKNAKYMSSSRQLRDIDISLSSTSTANYSLSKFSTIPEKGDSTNSKAQSGKVQ